MASATPGLPRERCPRKACEPRRERECDAEPRHADEPQPREYTPLAARRGDDHGLKQADHDCHPRQGEQQTCPDDQVPDPPDCPASTRGRKNPECRGRENDEEGNREPLGRHVGRPGTLHQVTAKVGPVVVGQAVHVAGRDSGGSQKVLHVARGAQEHEHLRRHEDPLHDRDRTRHYADHEQGAQHAGVFSDLGTGPPDEVEQAHEHRIARAVELRAQRQVHAEPKVRPHQVAELGRGL